jgi:hypothetical protein
MANPLADTEMDYKNKFQMKEMNHIEKRKKTLVILGPVS